MSEKQMALISGASASGKSIALRNIRNQEKWLYLNAESGKRLPFRNKFDVKVIVDPFQVYEAFKYAKANPTMFEGIAIDTCTFLMDMFESIYVINSANTQKAWGDYNQYWRNLMQDFVANADIPVLIMGHTRSELNEAAMQMETSVPVKGSLKGVGIESFFSTVVSTKKIPIQKLEPYKTDNPLLKITEDEELVGFKHVFQTRITKETTGERIRSPLDMFNRSETYMDNDAQMLLDRLNSYYA